MKWNSLLTGLNYRLADLYLVVNDIQAVARRAGLNISMIRWTGLAVTDWFHVLDYALKQEQLVALLQTITRPEELGARDEFLLGAIKTLQNRQTPLESPLPQPVWQEPVVSDALEKLMSKESTLLPISFLEQGVNCARAVVRINVGTGLGTGFLIENNYIITNNHVIPDLATAAKAKVQFNYQSDWQGVILKPELYTLDADPNAQHFVTDPFDDYTIVKLNGNANSKYGQLTLGDVTPKKDDFVNIIQHPAGGLKQIALYHNVIMYVDDSRVQYLTDTLPGSSGSPVFDSTWNVVALHHSGGYVKEPGLNQPVFRNEGINIQLVKKALMNLAT